MRKSLPPIWALGLVFTGAIAFASADEKPDEAFKKELAALAGTWKPVSTEIDGNKVPDERLKEVVMTRDADGKIVGRRGDMIVMEGFVKKIDLSKTPKTADSEITAGENKGRTIEGIYELDGDTLRICAALPGNKRPTEFSAKAGSGCALMVYKREKKDGE